MDNLMKLDREDSQRFQCSPDTFLRRFQDGIALVHTGTNQMHVLNNTAARIWDLACAGNSRSEIQNTLLQEYNGASDQIRQEVDSLLSLLSKEDFLRLL
jgi:Coenzyme PQQ synthesis protein D (PqqD)